MNDSPGDVLDPKPWQVPGMPLLCRTCGGRHPAVTGECGYCSGRAKAKAKALAERVNCVPNPPGIKVCKSDWPG